MKLIELTKGYQAVVDDEDFEFLNQWLWHYSNGYAVRKDYPLGRREPPTLIRMHRLINQTPEGMDTDHINGNKLDNRKINLRSLDRSGNCHNRRRPRKDNQSGYTGVAWIRATGKWRALITVHGKDYYLGHYIKKEDAILARKEAELNIKELRNAVQS